MKAIRTAATNPRAERELQLWSDWHTSGKKPQKLAPLLESLQPLVHRTVNIYSAADVSPQALRAHTENQLIKGLNTYKPGRGSLGTHLNWQMRGVGRFVERYQNVARIPGSRIRYVGRYQQAKSKLTEELGREPTLSEIARKSRIPSYQVKRLGEELRPTYVLGMEPTGEGMMRSDVGDYTFNADRERLELIYPDLSPIEQLVVDYTLGRAGKPVITSTTKLAMKLGVSAGRISNARASIAKKTNALNWIR